MDLTGVPIRREKVHEPTPKLDTKLVVEGGRSGGETSNTNSVSTRRTTGTHGGAANVHSDGPPPHAHGRSPPRERPQQQQLIKRTSSILDKQYTEEDIGRILEPQIYTNTYPEIDFLFDRKRDMVTEKPYHLDGNPSYYTKDRMQQRADLKNEKIVKKAIQNFLTVFPFDTEETIGKDEYLKVQGKIMSLIRPDLKGDEGKRVLEADWHRDSKGKQRMTKEQMFDAVFEMADIWTPEIKAEQMAAFLELLKFKIKRDSTTVVNPYDIMH